MKMAEKFFYIKNRKNVIGPFPLDQISGMLHKHLLTRNDLISENRISWKTVGEVLFPEENKVQPIPQLDRLEPRPEIPAVTEEISVKPVIREIPVLRLPGITFLPDPVCATMALLWNSPRHLQHLYMMLADPSTDAEIKKRDRTYCLLTGGALIILEFMLFSLLTWVMVPELCGKLILAALLLFTGGSLLLCLGSLILSAAAELPQVIELPLIILLLVVFPFGIFAAGLPVCGLLAGGLPVCPWYWHLPVWIMSVSIMIGSMVNLALGMFHLNRTVFHFRTGNMVWVMILFILQFPVLFLIGWITCRSICN